MPDETPLDQVNEKLDELLIGLMREEVQAAYDLTTNNSSIVLEPQFDKYLAKESE